MHALHQVLHAFFNLHSFTLAMPDVWAGFQVNLRMMVVAEVLVLVFALTIAVIRGLPGRGAKPLRALMIRCGGRRLAAAVHPSQWDGRADRGRRQWFLHRTQRGKYRQCIAASLWKSHAGGGSGS